MSLSKSHNTTTRFATPLMLTLVVLTLGILVSSWSTVSVAATNDAEAPLGRLVAPIVIGTPEDVTVFPESIVLDSPRRVAHVAVTGVYAATAGGEPNVQDLTRAARFSVADDAVARVSGPRVEPVGDGQTVLRVEVGGHVREIPLLVLDQENSDPVSFHLETLTALSKQGCNSGACHGSPSGKGGFRLSLRAYDPVLDERTLVREEWGRRANVFEPEQSLLLRKPTLDVAHGGGKQLATDDYAFELLRDWIAQGCQVGDGSEPRCERIEVFPPQRVLHRPAQTQQLVVLGHMSDGTVRDVTRLAVFSSSDETVATVDGAGLVTGLDRGESAILVRFLEHIETSQLMFLKDIEGFAWEDVAAANYVDSHVLAKLRKLKIVPSEICSDEEFCAACTST
ncbi:MAG: Ig-like domain-containing protein [Pirellulales bacterium]